MSNPKFNVIPKLVFQIVQENIPVTIGWEGSFDISYSFEIPGKYGSIKIVMTKDGLEAQTRYDIKREVFDLDDIFEIVIASAQVMKARTPDSSNDDLAEYIGDTWCAIGVKLGRMTAETETITRYKMG